MLRIFRNIRKREIDQGKLLGYLKYATGEILLIVAGILIALAINNSNARSTKETRFNNGLSQLYTNLYCEIGHNEYIVKYLSEKLETALEEYDRVESISNAQFASRLYYLNQTGNIQYSSNSPNIILQLQESVTTEDQNSLVNQIGAYYTLYEKWDQDIDALKVGYFDDLLSDYGLSTPSVYQMTDISDEELSIIDGIKEDPKYWIQLRSTINKLNDLIYALDYKGNDMKALQELILEYEEPPKLNFKNVGILGSALPSGWERSIPMKLVDEGLSIWEIQLGLQEGEVKFRNGNTWNQNWGATNENDGTALFFGKNIEVDSGLYQIKLFLLDRKYTIVKLSKGQNH